MNWKMLKNDFKRNKTGNTALLLFMALAAGLVAAAVIIVTQLVVSISGMYETAQPPHFLQMHKGEIDQTAIDSFNESYEGVTSWQTLVIIDVYGDDLTIRGEETFTLADCVLDIGLVTQSEEHDFLLDEERNIIKLEDGEIGIPVILLDSYDIELGDTVTLTGNGVNKEFTVTAFVHDAQMNSTMCSSTRILISDGDYAELFGKVGEEEYLIETYFTDTAMAADYQSAYEQAELPQNGPAITYTMIFLLSALTDIMMALIFIMVSVLLIIIALLCLKYTVMAAMEEEIGEIGTMKAIGMSYKDIRSMYLGKMKILMAVGIVLGYMLAVIGTNVFTGHISRTFGKQNLSVLTLGIPVLACGLVYIITNGYCKRILKKMKKVTVVDALVTGKGFGKKEKVKNGLHRSRRMAVNPLLSVRETLQNFGGFVIVFIVMCIVAGIMIVPVNLVNTMESEAFITYMGSATEDVLIELETGDNLEGRYEGMKQVLDEDTGIQAYKESYVIRAAAVNTDDESMSLHVECGAEAGQGLEYLEGTAPAEPDEIALSNLNADEAGKSIGDTLEITWNGTTQIFTVSGIYQDVTSGGYTAKSRYDFPGQEPSRYSFAVSLAEGVDAKAKAAQWSDEMGGGYAILPAEEFVSQTLGGVVKQIKTAAAAVVIIGFLLAGLIILLFMKLRLAKDASQTAALKAIGFSNRDVRKQYLYKIMLTAVLGVAAGTLLANILGSGLASAVFSIMGLGITKITVIINPWIAVILIPAGLLAAAAAMTWASSGRIKEYNIISMINE